VAQNLLRSPGSQRIGIVDTISTRQSRRNQRQLLAPDVGPRVVAAQINVLVEDLLQAHVLHQRGRQRQAGSGDQAVVVKGYVESVETVR
jgi:hypothetical protein